MYQTKKQHMVFSTASANQIHLTTQLERTKPIHQPICCQNRDKTVIEDSYINTKRSKGKQKPSKFQEEDLRLQEAVAMQEDKHSDHC